jgi:chemotaxis protein CheC
LLQAALENSASGLSQMTGKPITVITSKVESIPIGQIASYMGGPETPMVGIYLLMDGDLPGQIMLMFPLSEALHLVDLLLGEMSGATTELGDLEKSALAEAGNVTASFFINKISSLTDTTSRPSPPAVMVDMLGAMLDVVTASLALITDELLIVETIFQEENRTVQAHFWVLPYPDNPTSNQG